MFKLMIVVIVLMLTCVSINANVSFITIDNSSVNDTCVDMRVDATHDSYTIEYVQDHVVYTPVYANNDVVNNNNNITNNNTTMIVNTIDSNDTVSNNNNNTTHAHATATHATHIVDSIVYTHTTTATVVHTATAMHVDSIHTTTSIHTTSIDVHTSAVTIATSACVHDAPISEQYSIDYTYYTQYVPSMQSSMYATTDACMYAMCACAYTTTSIGEYSPSTSDTSNSTITIVGSGCSILRLPYRAMRVIKRIDTSLHKRLRSMLNKLLIQSAINRLYIDVTTSRNTLWEVVC